MELRSGLRLGLFAASLVTGLSVNAQTPAATPVATPAPAPAPAVTAAPDWLNRITLGGDLRLRLNQIDDNGKKDFNEQIRARLVTTAKVNDQLTANFRVATFSSNAPSQNGITSSNENFGAGGAKKPFFLDIASLDYKPMAELTLTGGKAWNPYFSAGKNEMIWDSDVTFEGYQMKYMREMGSMKPFLTVAHAQLQDRTGTSAADIHLLGAQLGTGVTLGETTNLTIAVAHYTFNGLAGSAATEFGTARGNSTIGTPAAYRHEFRVGAADLELGMKLGSVPFTVYGTYAQNSAPSDNKDAYLAGARFGKVTKDAGTWAADYNYRDVKPDAVVGAFADGDFAGGGANVRGHKVALQYAVGTNVTLGTNVFFTTKNANTNGTDYKRYQLEAIASF